MGDLSPQQLRILHAIQRGASIYPVRPIGDQRGRPVKFDRAVKDGPGWRFRTIPATTIYALERRGLIRIPTIGNERVTLTDSGREVPT